MEKSVFNPEFQQQDTASKIVAGLERLAEAFRVLLWDHAKVLGLSPIQIQILIFMAYHDRSLQTVSHLALEFNLSKPTISEAVRVLVKKELVEKEPSELDRRAFSLQLTPGGKEVVRQTEHFARPVWERVSRLHGKDQEKLFSAVTTLIHDLNRVGVLSVQRTCKGCRFYEKKGKAHYCRFLQTNLPGRDLRIDCPEFEAMD